MPATRESIRKVVESIRDQYRGPGGAVAVIQDGELAEQLAWGYADLDRRIEMAPDIQMPICSITKQFLCMLLIDLQRNPPASFPTGKGDAMQQLSDALRQAVGDEASNKTGLTIQDLCNNQSGIRDYYAMSVLWGAKPGGQFSIEDKALDRVISFMFETGTQYSYSNTNFHIVARLIEKITNIPLGILFDERLFIPAKMATATLCPQTANHPGPCVGYEGNQGVGYLPATNNMEWSGDAGIVASLSDMIAYEQYVDRSWSDPRSLYRAIAEPQVFRRGTPSLYGYGLSHGKVGGKDRWVEYTGHGGALPGFRLRRLYVPSERLSVVVMFNHEADAAAAADDILKRVFNLPEPDTFPGSGESWVGNYLDPASQLAITISQGGPHHIFLNYAGEAEQLRFTSGGQEAKSQTTIVTRGEALCMRRLDDNNVISARRLSQDDPPSRRSNYIGQYHCAEAGSTFHCTGQGNLLYGSFDGYLGRGPAHLMHCLGDHVWALRCPRGLDAPAPGNWTVIFHCDEADNVDGVTIGCWLARNLPFMKL